MLVVVTSDHSTPSSGEMIHAGEPVPLMMHGQWTRRDRVDRFDEIEVASGALSPATQAIGASSYPRVN